MTTLVSERIGQFFIDHDRVEYTEYGSGDRWVVLIHGQLMPRRMQQPLARAQPRRVHARRARRDRVLEAVGALDAHMVHVRVQARRHRHLHLAHVALGRGGRGRSVTNYTVASLWIYSLVISYFAYCTILAANRLENFSSSC